MTNSRSQTGYRVHFLRYGNAHGPVEENSIRSIEYWGLGHSPRPPDLGEGFENPPCFGTEDEPTSFFYHGEENYADHYHLFRKESCFGVHPFFDLFKDTILADYDAREINSHGGWPDSAYHDGVTHCLLDLRHGLLLAAATRHESTSGENLRRGSTRYFNGDLRAAADAVSKEQERFVGDRRDPLLADGPQFFRDAQLSLPSFKT